MQSAFQIESGKTGNGSIAADDWHGRLAAHVHGDPVLAGELLLGRGHVELGVVEPAAWAVYGLPNVGHSKRGGGGAPLRTSGQEFRSDDGRLGSARSRAPMFVYCIICIFVYSWVCLKSRSGLGL